MKIEDVIKKGWDNRDRDRKTSNNSFYYDKDEDKFYSYHKEIASIDRFRETMSIKGLTSEYGNYCSRTTSCHFGKLVNYCLDNNLNFTIMK